MCYGTCTFELAPIFLQHWGYEERGRLPPSAWSKAMLGMDAGGGRPLPQKGSPLPSGGPWVLARKIFKSYMPNRAFWVYYVQ